MKKAIPIVFLMSVLLLFSFGTALVSSKTVSFELVPKTTTFKAGCPIELEFYSESDKEKPQLFIIHSYGKTVLDATIKQGNYFFKIPKNYSKKTGDVSWFLINKNEIIKSGTFEIQANDRTKTLIENYLGPRTIQAGGKEFTMMVSVPTDSFDNPKKENTELILKYQFLQDSTCINLITKDFIAWYDIFSPTKSGKLLVSTECNNTATKEIETEIYPNIATDFNIDYKRNHEFADGNQITYFTTSCIKDQYENTVIDGTLVSFIIKTQKNTVLKTFGTTINGVASAQILHPDHQEIYVVKGFVTGIAESNSIIINYNPIISNFNYSFSNNNRRITVGPIKSFMNQLIPDGIKVVVTVFCQNKLVATLQEDSSKGFAIFELSKDFCKEKSCRFEITTLGITKYTKTINNEHHK